LETGVLEGADPNAPNCAVSNGYDRPSGRQRGLYDQARTIEPRLKGQDLKYFAPLLDQLENGGYSAMLFELLHRDLEEWHPRRLPITDALREQQRQGLSALDVT
jgi:hypothetical protein